MKYCFKKFGQFCKQECEFSLECKKDSRNERKKRELNESIKVATSIQDWDAVKDFKNELDKL